MNTTRFSQAAVFMFLVAASVARADDEVKYVGDKGELTASLTLRDAQSGFAGESGELTTVEPNGQWTVARFLNARIEKPHRKGKLSKEALGKLADALKKNEMASLPATIGKVAGANPKSVMLSFGKHKSSFVLPAGGDLPKLDPQKKPEHEADRFAAIVTTLRSLLPAEKS